MENLRSLHLEDLPALGLPIGQQRRLEQALHMDYTQRNGTATQPSAHSTAQPLSQPPSQAPPPAQPPTQPPNQTVFQGVTPPGQPEDRPSSTYAMHLDRPNGKPEYLSIVDHLPGSAGSFRESKVAGGVDGQPELYMRTGYQKKLAKVSPNEWNCANAVIMDRLYRNGKLGPLGIREYLNYTFIINELIFLSRTSRRREFAKFPCRENFLFYSISVVPLTSLTSRLASYSSFSCLTHLILFQC